MKVGSNHVSTERLTALAFVGGQADETHDAEALRHVTTCDRCAARLARLAADAEQLRVAAFARADAAFPDAVLEAQRARILDRLANLGQVARVLRFPRRSREAAMPVSTGSRRWISVAAAAGLIIGLVAGQLIHLMPWDAARREGTLTVQAPARPAPLAVMGSGSGVSVADEQFLDEVEAAVQLRRAHSLRALDALTPSAGEFRDRGFAPR